MGFVLYQGVPQAVADQLANLRTCRCGGLCSRCWPEIRRRIAILHDRANLQTIAIRRRQLIRHLLKPTQQRRLPTCSQ